MHINYFSPESLQDESILSRLLDFLMTCQVIDAYHGRFIPQLGDSQGLEVTISRSRNFVPQQTLQKASSLVKDFNTSRPFPRKHTIVSDNSFFIHLTSIADSYSINIGCVALVSRTRIPYTKLNWVLDAFEDILSFRKQAVALSSQSEFLKLDIDSRALLDKSIGEIVHCAVNPNETLILYRSDDKDSYEVSYSSSETYFSIPARMGPIATCFENGEPVIIQDVTNRTDIVKQFGRYFSNPEFLRTKGYKSCALYPVQHNNECYCVIACLFSRKYAVSEIEKSVLHNISEMLSDYYRIWYEKAQISRDFEESSRIVKYVRQSLLIADIMHDATQDLVTARGHIGILNAKNSAEQDALSAALDTLKSLIVAARQFRTFFSIKTFDQEKESAIRRIVPKQYYENVCPYDLTKDVFIKYQDQMKTHKITPSNNCPRDLVLKGIRYNVLRALDNAVRNSIDHLRTKTHVSRTITVSATKHSSSSHHGLSVDFIEIDVADNGPGVEEEDRKKITEPFVSLRGGMGLGLPIIQAACEAHGGTMEIRSTWGEDFHVLMRLPAKH